MTCLPPPAPIAPRRAEAGWDAGAVARLALLCTVLGSAWAARSVFSPLQDLAKADLALSDIQLSLVQGAAMSIPSALLSIMLGRMIDTRNRTHILIMLAMLTMLGSMATGFSASFGDLVTWRAFAGLGMLEEAVIFSLVADLFPPEQRGRANIMIVVGEYGGSALGFALGGWLLPLAGYLPLASGHGDWRNVQILFGIAGLLLALPLLRLNEPVRHECGKAGAGLLQGWHALRRLGGFLWPLLLAQIAMITANNAASVWAVPIFMRDFGLSPMQVGSLAAVIMTVPPLIGAALGGVMVDRLRTRRGGTILVAVFASAIAVPAALFPLGENSTISAAMLSVLMMAHAAAGLSSSTVGVLAIPNELRGLWFGICGVPTALISFAAAPTLVAWIGEGGALATSLALVLSVSSLVAFGGYVASWRALRA